MANIFGGGFFGPPGSERKLVGQPAPQGMTAGAKPAPAAAPAPVPAAAAPQGLFQPRSLMGPAVYPVMKKGEAPCPVCRG
jgi:hypothetical protein